MGQIGRAAWDASGISTLATLMAAATAIAAIRLTRIALGYRVIEAGEGERLIAGTIVERLTRTSSGALELMKPRDRLPVVTIKHAGIAPVLRFEVIAPTN